MLFILYVFLYLIKIIPKIGYVKYNTFRPCYVKYIIYRIKGTRASFVLLRPLQVDDTVSFILCYKYVQYAVPADIIMQNKMVMFT